MGNILHNVGKWWVIDIFCSVYFIILAFVVQMLHFCNDL